MHVGAATVNKELIKLAQILDIAVEMRAIKENPARRVKPLQDKRCRVPRSMTDDEITSLLRTALKDKDGLFLGCAYQFTMIFLFTGMRRSELAWLEWDDIDFDYKLIHIHAKLDWNTKTGRARTVGMAEQIDSILRSLPRSGRFVFDNGRDNPMITAGSLSRSFHRLRKKAELPSQITLHSLRHTYISHLLRAGIDIRRVQELAGHERITTTQRYESWSGKTGQMHKCCLRW